MRFILIQEFLIIIPFFRVVRCLHQQKLFKEKSLWEFWDSKISDESLFSLAKRNSQNKVQFLRSIVFFSEVIKVLWINRHTVLVSNTLKQGCAFQKTYKVYQNHNALSKAQVNLLFQDGFWDESSGNFDHHLVAKPLKIFLETFLKNLMRFFLHMKPFNDEKTWKEYFEDMIFQRKIFGVFCWNFFSNFFS